MDVGDGYILAGGRMMELRWSRQRLDGITKWTSLAGRPVHIPRGQVWVEIMPIGSEVIFRGTEAALFASRPFHCVVELPHQSRFAPGGVVAVNDPFTGRLV